MKIYATIVKTFKENIRDWKVLILVLLFSPFFLLIMNLSYGGESTIYNLGVINLDSGIVSIELLHKIGNIEDSDGGKLFEIINIDSLDKLKSDVKNNTIDIGFIIPENYSKKLSSTADGNEVSSAILHFYGSMSNIRYTVAILMVSDALYAQGLEISEIILPFNIRETFVEEKVPLNEFEGYVPGLIALSVLMVLFTASASIVKENEKKTLVRLKLSRLGAFNFLLGISIVQAAIAVMALMLAYWTAIALGYQPSGHFGTVLIVGILSGFSIVAVSLIMACFLNTIFEVLTIGCLPFFLMMFFSGSMFPIPKVNIFSIGEHSFGFSDLLPLRHTASAFNKILNFGADISEITFELGMLIILTVLYFVLGIILYQKRKLSKA